MQFQIPADAPQQILDLPRDDRGFPIPYFTHYEDGSPDLRVADGRKQVECRDGQKCWVCGQSNDGDKAFIGGIMSYRNRTYSDAPSHVECAIFSAKHCPHLNGSLKKRRTNDLPDGSVTPVGMIEARPENVIVVVTNDFLYFRQIGLFRVAVVDRCVCFNGGERLPRSKVQKLLRSR